MNKAALTSEAITEMIGEGEASNKSCFETNSSAEGEISDQCGKESHQSLQQDIL